MRQEKAGESLGFQSGSSGRSWPKAGRIHMEHSLLRRQEATGDEQLASRCESHGSGAKTNLVYQVLSLRSPTATKW